MLNYKYDGKGLERAKRDFNLGKITTEEYKYYLTTLVNTIDKELEKRGAK